MMISHCRRRGLTMVELVVSMVIMAVLMSVMTGVIVLASQALPDTSDPGYKNSVALDIVDQIAGELFFATTITEATTTAVTFTVADRDHGASGPETIRYAWSGTPGDPLTRQYNGVTVITVCEDVQSLSLTYELTTGRRDGDPRVLMFVDNAGFLLASDTVRKSTLEGWGFTVQPISAAASQDFFNTAIAANDVIYVSSSANAGDVAGRLNNPSLGIVTEVKELYDELGLCKSATWTSQDTIVITDNAHPITSVFSTGSLQICSSSQGLAMRLQTLGPATRVLGEDPFYADDMLLTLEPGDAMYGGGTATSRRVALPWQRSSSTFDFNALNADGLTILRRSILWAAEPLVYSGIRITLGSGTGNEAVRTEVTMFNQPAAGGS